MPRTVEDGTSGQLHKKKKQREKLGNFEKYVKVSSKFRECKFDEIKKLNSYVAIYVQKKHQCPLSKGDKPPT